MRSRRVLGVFLLVALMPASVHAHGIGVECKAEGDQVYLEAFFDDDTPVAKARLRVFDMNEKVIAEGKTDEQGKWTFPRPTPGSYEVLVDAGAGHRRRIRIAIPDPAAPQPAETPVRVSEEPSREEATRVPWLRLLVGVLVIAGGSGLFLLVSMLRRSKRREDEVRPS